MEDRLADMGWKLVKLPESQKVGRGMNSREEVV